MLQPMRESRDLDCASICQQLLVDRLEWHPTSAVTKTAVIPIMLGLVLVMGKQIRGVIS